MTNKVMIGSAALAMLGTIMFRLTMVLGQPTAPGKSMTPLTAMPYSPSLDLTSLDRGVDPCVDFYKFSCGGWQKNNPIPADRASWSVYGKLANDNEQFLWGILAEAAAAKDRTPVQQKIGDYFAACMDTTAVDAHGYDPLEPGLARIDALKTPAAIVTALAGIYHDLPGTFFFDSGTEQDAIDASTMIAGVGAGGLGLPDRDYYLLTDPKSMEIRTKYVAYVVKLLSMIGEPEAQAKEDAASVMRIETALAKASLTRVDQRDPHKIYHKLTLAEIHALLPAMDWPVYFTLQGAAGVNSLNVSQPEFMKAVNAELAAEPVAALQAYLRFHLATVEAASLAKPTIGHELTHARLTMKGGSLTLKVT